MVLHGRFQDVKCVVTLSLPHFTLGVKAYVQPKSSIPIGVRVEISLKGGLFTLGVKGWNRKKKLLFSICPELLVNKCWTFMALYWPPKLRKGYHPICKRLSSNLKGYHPIWKGDHPICKRLSSNLKKDIIQFVKDYHPIWQPLGPIFQHLLISRHQCSSNY